MRTIDMLNLMFETTATGKRGSLDSDLKTLYTDFLNIEYEKIFNLYPWDDIKIFNLSATTTDGTIILPNYVGAVRGCRKTTTPIFPVGEILINYFNPNAFDTAGAASGFTFLPSSPVLSPLSAASTLIVVSDSTSDATASSLVVRVEGLVSGEPDFEEFTLNGTTDVTGSKSFTELLSITKPRTTGRVTIDNSAGTAIGTIGPDDRKGRYRRVLTYPIVDESTTLTFQCTRAFEPLVSDNDAVSIDGIESAVLDRAIARAFTKQGDTERAAVHNGYAKEALDVALNYHDKINHKDQRSLPSQGNFEFDEEQFSRDFTITGTGHPQWL